jgi:hypothetical protein
MRPRSGIASVSVTTTTGNYKDLADFGLTVDGWGEAMGGPTREYPVASRPGRIGQSKLSTDPLYESKTVTLTGTVTADTFAAHITALDGLKGWCARAVALKISSLDSTRFLQCNLVAVNVEPIGVPARTPASRVALTFEALEDPLWYATSATSNSLTTSLTEQPLGTAPVRPVITVTGNPSAFSLTYANSAGTTVQTLALAALETSGATQIVIDMANLTVVQTISAVDASAIAKITTGDFFALDPKDADTVTPTWPKLLYTATGTVSAVSCVYRRAYW